MTNKDSLIKTALDAELWVSLDVKYIKCSSSLSDCFWMACERVMAQKQGVKVWHKSQQSQDFFLTGEWVYAESS